MCPAEFGPTGFAYQQIIKPNNTPCRVFYRTRRKSGFLKSIVGKIIMKRNQKLVLSTAMGAAFASGSALAGVPAAVTSALSDAATDAATVGTAVLVVIVAIYAFKLLRRAL